jgi:hypothetical protein
MQARRFVEILTPDGKSLPLMASSPDLSSLYHSWQDENKEVFRPRLSHTDSDKALSVTEVLQFNGNHLIVRPRRSLEMAADGSRRLTQFPIQVVPFQSEKRMEEVSEETPIGDLFERAE